MRVLETVAEVREAVAQARSAGQMIGLVPTMGAFHAGHLSLMQRAHAECDLAIVSLFVNPTQFAPTEDLSRYPRDLGRDRALALEAGVDVLFVPGVAEVYPPGFATYVEVERLDRGLCGRTRPGHFRGVATVVAKLFQMVQPGRAYFGRKDFQQLRIVQQMTADLNFPIQIVPMPIVREADGVAMSSRNAYLSADQRVAARVLHQALAAAEADYAAGNREGTRILSQVREHIRAEPRAQLEYIELVDAVTLEPVTMLDHPALLAVAAHFGTTRLIDNTVLGEASPQ